MGSPDAAPHMEVEPRRLPLEPLLEQHGASFELVGDWRVPSRFGDPLEEYRAARGGAGVTDSSHQGRIAVRGPDRRLVLDGLLSSDVRDLRPGQGRAACLLTTTGGMDADVTLYDRGDDVLCVLRPEGTAPFVAALQGRLSQTGSTIENAVSRTVLLLFTGPRHRPVLEAVLGAPLEVADGGCGRHEWNGEPLWLLSYPAERPVDHFVEIPGVVAPAFFDALRPHLARGALRLVGRDAQEILRIEAGRPILGIDMDASHDPREVNLGDAVSATKTGYRGWEALAERRRQGGPDRRLVGLRAAGACPPGSSIVLDGAVVGRITSAAWSPCLGAPLGLAVLPAGIPYGTRLEVRGRGPETEATVVDLPIAA